MDRRVNLKQTHIYHNILSSPFVLSVSSLMHSINSIIHEQFSLLKVFRYHTAFRLELGDHLIGSRLIKDKKKKEIKRTFLDLNTGLVNINVVLDRLLLKRRTESETEIKYQVHLLKGYRPERNDLLCYLFIFNE